MTSCTHEAPNLTSHLEMDPSLIFIMGCSSKIHNLSFLIEITHHLSQNNLEGEISLFEHTYQFI